MFDGDFAETTIEWLGLVHMARNDPDMYPNRRAMYDQLRSLIEQHIFGGRNLDNELSLLAGKQAAQLNSRRVAELSAVIRKAMRENRDLKQQAWAILGQEPNIVGVMPFPRLDP